MNELDGTYGTAQAAIGDVQLPQRAGQPDRATVLRGLTGGDCDPTTTVTSIVSF